jgi:hypothetical protein
MDRCPVATPTAAEARRPAPRARGRLHPATPPNTSASLPVPPVSAFGQNSDSASRAVDVARSQQGGAT